MTNFSFLIQPHSSFWERLDQTESSVISSVLKNRIIQKHSSAVLILLVKAFFYSAVTWRTACSGWNVRKLHLNYMISVIWKTLLLPPQRKDFPSFHSYFWPLTFSTFLMSILPGIMEQISMKRQLRAFQKPHAWSNPRSSEEALWSLPLFTVSASISTHGWTNQKRALRESQYLLTEYFDHYTVTFMQILSLPFDCCCINQQVFKCA